MDFNYSMHISKLWAKVFERKWYKMDGKRALSSPACKWKSTTPSPFSQVWFLEDDRGIEKGQRQGLRNLVSMFGMSWSAFWVISPLCGHPFSSYIFLYFALWLCCRPWMSRKIDQVLFYLAFRVCFIWFLLLFLSADHYFKEERDMVVRRLLML